VPYLIQEFRVRLENLRVAMRGITNVIVPPICIHAMLTLAQHAIGWSGKNLEHELRETKAWEEENNKIRMRRQD